MIHKQLETAFSEIETFEQLQIFMKYAAAFFNRQEDKQK